MRARGFDGHPVTVGLLPAMPLRIVVVGPAFVLRAMDACSFSFACNVRSAPQKALCIANRWDLGFCNAMQVQEVDSIVKSFAVPNR